MRAASSVVKSAPILILGLILILSLHCKTLQYSRMLSLEEYYQQDGINPYILELDTKTGGLLYYGVFHTLDPRDPQISNIEQKWNEFKPTVAYSEGGVWPVDDSRERTIQQYGEQGFLRYLADRDGVPIRSIESPKHLEVSYLRNYFFPRHIKVYYILKYATLRKRLGRDLSNARLEERIQKLFSDSDISRYHPRSLAEFEAIVSQCFPDLKDWRSIPPHYFYFSKQGKFLVDIHYKLNDYRNRNMLKTLVNGLKKGERIFAVVGRSHVVSQEPALRAEID